MADRDTCLKNCLDAVAGGPKSSLVLVVACLFLGKIHKEHPNTGTGESK